jgi:hypothetical protein
MTAPTLEWLRVLGRSTRRDLAERIAIGLVHGFRYFSIEAYESTLARAAAVFPWMHITHLAPHPWEPADPCGAPLPDVALLCYRCAPMAPVDAGLLPADAVPQGRKRIAYSSGLRVERLSPAEISVGTIEVRDDLPDSDPLAIFRPSVIRSAGPGRQPRVSAAAVLGGLRLVVDNTREAS